ncbi:MAG TPA: hypothetical protein DCM07_26145 [Planctomycetaceae bacterium]|nr:hypothetical protein [Gimesia sp.]HAH48267.1 hypothetical protein [Planctomycetaceae bacterium]
MLLIGSHPVQAEFPSKKYEMGFETVTVFEYKKTLREANAEIPDFPPRTETAVIVKLVESNSRASLAGLKENDLIRVINGSYLRSPNAADQKLSVITNRDQLILGIIRRVDDKWDQISIIMEPISDAAALKLMLRKLPSLDGAFLPYYRISHKHAPATRYAPDNFQLYFTERAGRPEKLYLRIAQLLPGHSRSGPFVVTTAGGRFVFESEVVQPNQRGLFFAGSLRSPEWEPVRVEILLIQSADWLTEKHQEFQQTEAIYKQDYQGFKYDQSRRDKAYQELNQRRLSLITDMERINQKIQAAERNHQLLVQRKERLANPSAVLSRNQFKLTDDAREAIKSHYAALTAEQKKIVTRAFRYGISLGLKEAELLQLEETSLAEQEIRRKRDKQGWLWVDAPLTPDQIPMLRAIISAPSATVHHESSPEQIFEVTAEQKERLQVVLDVYEAERNK